MSFPWVVLTELDLRERPEFYTDLNCACMDHALDLARGDGFDWLLSIDADEFAFGSHLPLETDPPNLSRAGNLPRMLSEAAPETMMISLPTIELLPQSQQNNAPFWAHRFFQHSNPVRREILHPVTGELRFWNDFLGHHEGKSIVRVNANAQAYDSHRWVVDHGRSLPDRPDFVPLPTEERGCHLHYLLTNASHWKEKYSKMVDEPAVWPCGTAVEFPKQCWKEAVVALSEDDATAYFNQWVGLPAKELVALEASGKVLMIDVVSQVLKENGYLRDGSTMTEPNIASSSAQTNPPVLHLSELSREESSTSRESVEIGRLSPRRLRGFHGVEIAEDKIFRWAEPEAAIQLEAPALDYHAVLRLDSLQGLCRGLISANFNGEELPIEHPNDAPWKILLQLQRELFCESGPENNWLELSFHPVDTSDWPGEQRRLGAALFRLELIPLASMRDPQTE